MGGGGWGVGAEPSKHAQDVACWEMLVPRGLLTSAHPENTIQEALSLPGEMVTVGNVDACLKDTRWKCPGIRPAMLGHIKTTSGSFTTLCPREITWRQQTQAAG